VAGGAAGWGVLLSLSLGVLLLVCGYNIGI